MNGLINLYVVCELFLSFYTVKQLHYRPGCGPEGGRGIALLFQDLGARREWVVSSTPRLLFTPGKDPGTHCTGGWVGPRAGLDKQKISPPPGFDPWTVQPVVSCYTDWATQPTSFLLHCLLNDRCFSPVWFGGVKHLVAGGYSSSLNMCTTCATYIDPVTAVLWAAPVDIRINPLNAELNPICHLLALLGVHFLHVSRIRVKSLTLRLLMSCIYGAPILDVSRSHTTTHHSR